MPRMPTSATLKNYVDARIDRINDRIDAMEKAWAKDVERVKADTIAAAADKAAAIVAAATARNRFVTIVVAIGTAIGGGIIAFLKTGSTGK